MTRIVRVPPGTRPVPDLLAPVAAAAAAGELVIFPTETVYGVGTNGLLPAAAARLYALKGRDSAKPLPILVHSTEDARRWAEFGPEAAALALAFWPGALTLVLEPTEEGRRLLSPGARTLALRVPDHAVTRALIEASAVPWATTSANLSGAPAAADAGSAVSALGREVGWAVDAGPAGGTASSVVEVRGGRIAVLREGALDRETLEKAVQRP